MPILENIKPEYFLPSSEARRVSENAKNDIEPILMKILQAAQCGLFEVEIINKVSGVYIHWPYKGMLEKLGYEVTSYYTQPYNVSDKQEDTLKISWRNAK